MVCDNCGSGEPVIHLTQIVNNEMTTVHLCEKCGAEKGLEPSSGSENIPLADFLAQMGEGEGARGEGSAPGRSCEFCGLTFREFRETGRLGCPHCWETFSGHLRGLVRRIHGSTRHVGKVYLAPDATGAEVEARVEGLRRKLVRAVELEDFESAARLRDEIRALVPAGGDPEDG
jgi:protein arginine kinase activator